MSLSLAASIAAAILEGPEGMPSADLEIMGVNSKNEEILRPVRFQYWPETVQVSSDSGWNPREVPGSSHKLKQWGGSSGLGISFEVSVGRDMMDPDDRVGTRKLFDFAINPYEASHIQDNYPVEAFYRYMIAYTQPGRTKGAGGSQIMTPPPIAILSMPGLALAPNGGDVFWATINNVELTVQACWPNGRPRLASIALSMDQMVQSSDGVFWADQVDWAEKHPRYANIPQGALSKGTGPKGF